MTGREEHIAHLIKKRWLGELTEEELSLLNKWLDEDRLNREFFEYMNTPEFFRSAELTYNQLDKETVSKRIQQEFPFKKQGNSISQAVVHRVHFLKTAWVRYAAAIIIILGIGAYLWNTQQKEKPLITEMKPVPVKNDVAPGSTKATLTLSDGRKVELTPETGTIAETGINIENANGRLEYGKAEKVVFNTMTTPRGGQYQLTLPDGTNVWLNAASSISYPTAFAGNIREVTITGEAYFEVEKNPSKPFVVKTPKEDITVLGTHFNVNAYNDEPVMKTSLIEGSVKVGKAVLRPGQAYINGKVVTTNLDQDVAWKNGAFNFEDMDLAAAFRALSRWYNVDVKYAGAIPNKRVRGEMGRDLTLSEVLKAFGQLGINTRIEGNALVVLPK